MENGHKIKVKISLVGDASVGKTSLIRRYVLDIFDDEYITTIGTKVSKKRVIVKNNKKKFDITLSIWDILGQKDFKNIQKMAFKGSKGLILVCDRTREETLYNLSKWHENVECVTGKIPTILMANKSDLIDHISLKEENVSDFATNLNIPFFLTSAKEGTDVIKAFFKISDLIIQEFMIKMS